MDSMLDRLQARASIPARQLAEPAPNDTQLEQILRCGLSAPDHAKLRPWRFIIVRGDARQALADVMVEAATQRSPDISTSKLDSVREKPMRSPLIVIIVATITPDHPKTPEVEQILSAGAAAQQIQLGATALGFGSVWLTGSNAYDPHIKRALGVEPQDAIVGFIYMGTPITEQPTRARPDLAAHVSEWHG